MNPLKEDLSWKSKTIVAMICLSFFIAGGLVGGLTEKLIGPSSSDIDSGTHGELGKPNR